MLGNPDWFSRRKYSGWGISPKTWQGWVYLAVIIVPFAIFQSMPSIDIKSKLYITIGWLVFLFLDVGHIMLSLKRDEREHKIEAISERNAAWAMILCMIIGVLYQIYTSSLQQTIAVDWFLVAALFGGLLAKSISNFVLERKAL